MIFDASCPGAGRAGGGPLFVEETNIPAGKALIYIYQPSTGISWKGEPLLLAKEGPLGVLLTNSYYFCIVNPGIIKLWLVSLETRELKLEVVAGSAYFVQGRLSISGQGGLSRFSFELLPREKALKEIRNCRLLTE